MCPNLSCSFSCCDETFTTSKAFKSHKQKYHRIIKKIKYPCEICGNELKDKGKLRKHLKLHSDPSAIPFRYVQYMRSHCKSSLDSWGILRNASCFTYITDINFQMWLVRLQGSCYKYKCCQCTLGQSQENVPQGRIWIWTASLCAGKDEDSNTSQHTFTVIVMGWDL